MVEKLDINVSTRIGIVSRALRASQTTGVLIGFDLLRDYAKLRIIAGLVHHPEQDPQHRGTEEAEDLVGRWESQSSNAIVTLVCFAGSVC